MKLYDLFVRDANGRFRKVTGYPMPRKECMVMKSKFRQWSQARMFVVEATGTNE